MDSTEAETPPDPERSLTPWICVDAGCRTHNTDVVPVRPVALVPRSNVGATHAHGWPPPKRGGSGRPGGIAACRRLQRHLCGG